MKKQYPFSAYDKDLYLRVSIPMWGAILFLARPFAILIMSVANKRDRTGMLETFYHDYVSLTIDTFAALPALLVIIAWARRQPGASQPIRRIWAQGRLLLILATVLNIASLFIPLLWNPDLRMDTPEFVKLAVCAAILFMLLKSERVRDTFNDFPQPTEEEKKPADR
jgi:hypothetical protein